MTFKEKLQIEHPEAFHKPSGNSMCCPESWGYEPPQDCINTGRTCEECWNREMPTVKDIAQKHMDDEINNLMKGEKEMGDTKKTKKELLEEIAELKKEVARVDQRKQFEDAASALKMQYDALVDAGFDSDNALIILNNMIKAAGGVK